MKYHYCIVALCCYFQLAAQTYSGTVTDKNSGIPINNAKIKLVETNQETITTNNGQFTFSVTDNSQRSLQINKEGYMFEDIRNLAPSTNLSIQLRAKIKSAATLRWENYISNCTVYNTPNIPDNPEWNVAFKKTNLTGDFAPNATYTRRDPSAIIQYDGLYYVWYTYKISQPSTYFGTTNVNDNVFPWDYSDIYYATSPDGYQWTEQGPAVVRGASGSFDDRSVFTPEILAYNNKFYLVYQAVKHPYTQRVKNTVAMAVADSPSGPWTKLEEPILRATDNGIWNPNSTSRFDALEQGDFDSQKVHDPCIMAYKNKFYLYYKGERMGEKQYCGEREIRWGVAIADKPTGPYVKSEYNPITTTGHEVSVWNYDSGIAIIQKLDGPERGSVQYATDGLNFEMTGKATDVPDALGIFRPNASGVTPTFGISWGLAHVLKWDGQVQGGWMHLERFDLIKPIIPPSNSALIIEAESYITTKNDVGFTPGGYNGVNRTATGVNFVNRQDWMEFTVNIPESGNYELTYLIGTINNNAHVEMQIDGVVVADTKVNNTGGWDKYEFLRDTNKLIEIQAGTHTIRITANGSDDWQWNMDKFYLEKKSEISLSVPAFLLKNNKELIIYPNPSSSFLNIKNFSTEVGYVLYDFFGKRIKKGKTAPDKPIEIHNLQKGIYFLTVGDTDKQSVLFVKK
ncbi:carbohydrate-binding protein [Mariniflexile maritimum]|uniref:carbohydrate-binding protein n=1 Tax=Mariniflexile maritimum TaxID=2682493 RepID=UPI0012F64F8B|nr:carbohydrate-binding protein [Mariniflexile maritimum]